MDLTFTAAKPQTLILSSSTPLPFLSPTKLASFRRQFLGTSHSLSSPGNLRARRKCKRLGLFQIHSSRFLIKVSLDSRLVQIAIVIAVFSAISLYVNHYQKRKKNEKQKEVSGSPSHSISQVDKDTVKKHTESMDMVVCANEDKMFDIETEVLVDKSRNTRYISEHNKGTLQVGEPALTHGDNLVTTTLDSSSDVLSSGVSNPLLSNQSEVKDQSRVPVISELGAARPVSFSTEMTEFQLEGFRDETKLDYIFPSLMSKNHYNTINNTLAEVHEHIQENHEVGAKHDAHYDCFCSEPVREELHTFYEENKPVTDPLANLNGTKSLSSFPSLLASKKLFTPVTNNVLHGAELPLKENSRGRNALSRKRKDVQNENGYLKVDVQRHKPQNKNRSLPKFPNGLRVNVKLHSSDPLSDYKGLLRDERLTECIELLEGIEKINALDMKKIYHAEFFETCKSQKAVKEAFRFTKLISNPTLSTFNMLMSVCACSQDSGGAFEVLQLVQEAGLKVDCKLYTTLISTCAKSGKVDSMFEVFHEMVNAGVEPNINTYGALIDGCSRAGQVAKAFGAYGILRSKNVKPDRIIFNALISACGQSGAVDRAFDVLDEMGTEIHPIDPDHITVGALIKACTDAGQVDRAKEVYKMLHKYKIKGTPEVYTIAVNFCSHTGDWEFAYSVYNDMKRNGVVPDEMFFSALVDVAGHAGKVDAAFRILNEAWNQGVRLGIVSYSSLMGACCNAKNWQKAQEVYENIKSMNLKPTISTMNALITALCDGDQLQEALGVLSEIKRLGLWPNGITYSVLIVACEKKDDLEVGIMLFSQAKTDGISRNLVMYKCLIGMCLRGFEKASALGDPVLSFTSGRPQIENKWTSEALMAYREIVAAGTVFTVEIVSQVLGCLKLPSDPSLKNRLIENLGVSFEISRFPDLYSLIDGFGEYDSRAFSLFEEASSLGIVPSVSFKASPIIVDARTLQKHTAEVYLLTVLKGLKNRLAAGAKLPNITILLPIEKTNIPCLKADKTINLAGRTGQLIAALLRRLGLRYQGNGSSGKIKINGLSLRRWFQPKIASPFTGEHGELSSSQSRLGKGITHQQRLIRTGNLSMEL